MFVRLYKIWTFKLISKLKFNNLADIRIVDIRLGPRKLLCASKNANIMSKIWSKCGSTLKGLTTTIIKKWWDYFCRAWKMKLCYEINNSIQNEVMRFWT